MDAEHRHELHQNDLAEFMAHFGEWWSKHGLRTLLIVFVAVGAAFLYRMHRTGADRAHDQAWTDLDQAASAAQYRTVAKSYDNPAIQALAYLRAGDMALQKAITPAEKLDADDDETADELAERRTRLLDAAERDYNAVVDHPAAHKVIKLNAMLGLASVAESRLSWDKARQIYQQIQDQAPAGNDGLAKIASRRAAALERAAMPVVFAPDPSPPPEVAPELAPAEGSDSSVEVPAEPEAEPESTPETPADSKPADPQPTPADTP